MHRQVILSSSLTNPKKLKHLFKKGGMWLYAGEDIGRFKIFEDAFDQYFTPVSYSQYHNFISTKRTDFIEWTETVHHQNGQNLIHWLSNTFSSNPYASKVFLYCMNLAWFQDILNIYSEKDILFIAESHAVLLVAEEIASSCDNNRIYKIGFFKEKIRSSYKIFINTLKAPARYLTFIFRYILSHTFPSFKDDPELKNVSIIMDTFLFENSFDNGGKFKNRYFVELYDYLTKNGVSVALFPVFHNISLKNFRSIVKSIHQNKTQILLLEDYLKLYDYIYLLFVPLRYINNFERVPPFLGINVQPLVDEENWFNVFSFSYIVQLLRYKLPQRLCEAGFSPKYYINWSENQTIHKASILGFHHYLPTAEVVGGKPFIAPANHLNLFINNAERMHGVAPDRIITSGKKLKIMFSRYDKNGHYDIGASFRYSYLFDILESNNLGHNLEMILVLLPYHLELSKYILRLTAAALRKAMDNDYSIFIKAHPTVKEKELMKLFDEVNFYDKRIKVSRDDLKFLLPKSSAIVTSASSATCEAICLGIPVVLVGMPIGLDLNMYDFMPPSMWKLAYTDSDIDISLNKWALQHPLSLDERKKIGKQVLNEIFEPITEQSMKVYLGEKAGTCFNAVN